MPCRPRIEYRQGQFMLVVGSDVVSAISYNDGDPMHFLKELQRRSDNVDAANRAPNEPMQGGGSIQVGAVAAQIYNPPRYEIEFKHTGKYWKYRITKKNYGSTPVLVQDWTNTSTDAKTIAVNMAESALKDYKIDTADFVRVYDA